MHHRRKKGGVRSGTGEARTILLLHIISVRTSKQPLMVRTLLKVYMELGSYFCFCKNKYKTSSSAEEQDAEQERAAADLV